MKVTVNDGIFLSFKVKIRGVADSGAPLYPLKTFVKSVASRNAIKLNLSWFFSHSTSTYPAKTNLYTPLKYLKMQ